MIPGRGMGDRYGVERSVLYVFMGDGDQCLYME
jgi:hypothetical protein